MGQHASTVRQVRDLSVATGFTRRRSRSRLGVQRRLAGLTGSEKNGKTLGSGRRGAKDPGGEKQIALPELPDAAPRAAPRGIGFFGRSRNESLLGSSNSLSHWRQFQDTHARPSPSLEEPRPAPSSVNTSQSKRQKLPERLRTLSQSSQASNPSSPAERSPGVGVDEPAVDHAMSSALQPSQSGRRKCSRLLLITSLLSH